MPESTQPVSADKALKAVSEAIAVLDAARDHSGTPDEQTDAQIAALVQAGFVFARNANPNA